MTKEFKKITNKSETRYVLESMTTGATGSASIAAAPGRLGKLQKRLQELKDKVPQKPRQGPLKPQTGAGVHKNKKKDQQRGLEKHKGQSVYQEEFNGEYDDEAGMAESNLHTLARAVKGLMDTIDSNDNLPEWCQEKIAKAEMMLVSVWDYLLSQKEQGIDPEQSVAEGSTDLVQIEYWQQETMESGRWVKTKPMPRATAEKIVNSFERGEIVDVEQGVAEEHNDTFDPKSHQYKTTMKHADKPTVQQRMAAHDIKPGIAGYRDRIDMLRDLERTGKLKKDEGVDQSPESEILQSRIGSVLINLYDKGYTEEKIRMMQARIAKHLGYDPSDKQFQFAFNAAMTDPEQGVDEGTNDSTQVLSDIVANEDFDALYDLMSSDTEAGKIVQRMYNDVSGEEGLHPDDDFEEILSIVLDRLTQDYGQQGVAETSVGVRPSQFNPQEDFEDFAYYVTNNYPGAAESIRLMHGHDTPGSQIKQVAQGILAYAKSNPDVVNSDMHRALEELKGLLTQDVAEGPNDGREDNFTIDDIKRLEKIKDLETLKAQAKELIKGKPVRRMKPEKISWFYNHIDTLKNPLAVIKMMYDLMLAGEGHKVIGSRNSMSANSYRTKFGEQGVAESERTMSRAGKGVMKYGKDGMKALAKAGREGASEKKLDSIRDKYDNYTEGLRPGEYHIASVIFDNGTVKKIRVPSDNLPQSFFDRVKKNYEQQGLNVVDIKMDHGVHNSLAAEGGKKKGADGKACWKGYRYAGTKNGKDSCVKVGEDTYTEHLLSQLQEKFASQQQAKLMYAVAGDRDVAKKTGVSTATAREYIKKSHGQQVKDLPKKVKKK